MGQLQSNTDHTGAVIYGVTLGKPSQLPYEVEHLAIWAWEDEALPNGRITGDGRVVVDQPERITPWPM